MRVERILALLTALTIVLSLSSSAVYTTLFGVRGIPIDLPPEIARANSGEAVEYFTTTVWPRIAGGKPKPE